jgi:hypothetical protein
LYCLKIIPDKAIPYDGANAYMVSLFFEVGETEKALEIIRIMGERAEEILAYKVKERLPIDHEMQKQIAIIHEITRTLFQAGQEELAQMYQDIFHQYYSIIEQ